MREPTQAELLAQLAAMQAQVAKLQQQLTAQQTGSGSVAQDERVAAGEEAIAAGGDLRDNTITKGDRNVTGDKNIVYNIETGATVVIGELPITMTAVDRESALGRYLHHVISRNRYLQLQGIRSGGKLVQIELDHIYIRLRATQQRLVETEARWLAEEAMLAPGEAYRRHAGGLGGPRFTTETVTVKVEEAMRDHIRLVVLGDPGSGKTTLLRYLALLYARDLAEGSTVVQGKLVADEPARLPIVLPLRLLGAYLRDHADASVEGHKLLLDFFLRALANERITLPETFFDEWLTNGNAVILLDGLDEVADPDLRRRIARLVENFTGAYGECRYVVTSRIVGYSGTARLGEGYATTTVRDFTLADVQQFLLNWHRLVAIGQMGAGASAEAYAIAQTRQLVQAIEANERIRDLAINPLLLTVIALVHRDRVQLPDRRAELYAEAVDVLLGKWDEARGVVDAPILPGLPFDTGDRRLMLQHVALHMHEQQWKEIDVGDLRLLLQAMFAEIVGDARQSEAAVNRFLQVIEERSGLLVARGEGVYAFSHLTFQEYLAALAVTGQDDYIAYTLPRTAEPWWREVILLTAGHLSTQSKARTTRFIGAIADKTEEPEPYHNLVLAAECLRDVGSSRVQGDLQAHTLARLRQGVETPRPVISRWFRRLDSKGWITRRSKAMEALVAVGAAYWTLPDGEPEWVEVPAGEFWMGGDGELEHKVHLDRFWIARVSITNAQYHLFTQATAHAAPEQWDDKRPPKALESHPVVNVTWHDALAYCAWLSKVTGKTITLPSEAQWEKAARGDQDKRAYPWGDAFDATKCNSYDLGLGSTTPVGIFPDGASPYGCLDMAGNVWEWTRSLYQGYPYNPQDGREDLAASDATRRVVRGGSFGYDQVDVRCAFRIRTNSGSRDHGLGFRVVCAPGLCPLSDGASGL